VIARVRTPIRTKPLLREERRDCKNCGRKLRRATFATWDSRMGTVSQVWVHVRTSTCTPDPYKTKRTPKRTSLTTQCDSLWAAIVKFFGHCVVCGDHSVQAAHIIGRAQRVVRWSIDPMNGLPLCPPHHRDFDSYKIDRDRLINLVIGADAHAALVVKAQGVWDKTFPLEELKARLQELKEAR
jgi:hypothetical protein